MKKQYIQPESHVVAVKLFGAVLDYTGGFGTESQGTDHLSRRQAEDRFEDYDEEKWDWE